ncbi:MAG: hydroxymethylbilane synthase [Aestuariivita sp.]|nr:hydroxymethylbilane synthase [Aestuariivita sp.]MCY4202767.1 hydroxymethylbilane synthase [Aestuariivita sp.]
MPSSLPSSDRPLRIGTRGSPLALAQAHECRHRLMDTFSLSEDTLQIIIIKVTGDLIHNRPLREIGGKGLFTREIEEALLSNTIDIAVHSMKDMPTEQPHGLTLDVYLPREDVRDAFISKHTSNLADLPSGLTVGTSSLRRRAQVLHRRSDLNVVEFRGNLQTRLKKLSDGVADCTFLAVAGINRLALTTVPAYPIDPDIMLPAVAQGAIGIERRSHDSYVADLLMAIHDPRTAQQLVAERSFLATLDGSCETPIAGLAEIKGSNLSMRGEVLRPDGSEVIGDRLSGPIEDGKEIGRELAQSILAKIGSDFFSD